MAKHLLPQYAGAFSLAAGGTFYGDPGSSAPLGLTTETLARATHRGEGVTISKLRGYASNNARAATATTITWIKNGGATSLAISIGAGLTGAFEDLVDSVPLIAGDTHSTQWVYGSEAAASSITVWLQSQVETAGGASSLLATTGGNSLAISTASTVGHHRFQGTGTTAASNNDRPANEWPVAGSFSGVYGYVAVNDRADATTFALHKNGASAISASVGAGMTGRFENTASTTTTAVGDDIQVRITTGAGVGSITPYWVGSHFTPTTAGEFPLGVTFVPTGNPPMASGATAYAGLTINATEAFVQFKARFATSFSRAALRASVNTCTTATTLTSRKNGADGSQAVSIAAGATGVAVDTTNVDRLADGDLYNCKLIYGTMADTASRFAVDMKGAEGAAYSGSGAVTIAKQSASGSGTRALPVYSGTGGVTIDKQSASGSGTRTVPVFSATGGATIDKQSASGAGTRTVPVFSGSSAITIAKQSASGSGNTEVPVYTAAGAVEIRKASVGGTATIPTSDAVGAAPIPKQSVLGVGDVEPPLFAGAGAIAIPKQSAAGSGTRTIPVFEGIGALLIPAPVITAEATNVAPVFSATGAIDIGKQDAAGLASVAAPGFFAAGAITIDKQEAAGSGSHAPRVFAGVGGVTLAKPEFASAADVEVPVYSGTGAAYVPAFTVGGVGGVTVPLFPAIGDLSIPKAALKGSGVRTSPAFTGSGAAEIARSIAAGTAIAAPPAFVGVGAIIIPAQGAAGAGTASPSIFTASGAISIPKQSASGSGGVAAPGAFVGMGGVQIPRQDASGAGARTILERLAIGAVAIPKPVVTGEAALTGVHAFAAGAVAIPKQAASGSAGFAIPGVVAVGAMVVPMPLAEGSGAFSGLPGVAASGGVGIPKQAASGAGAFTAPTVHTGAGAIIILAQVASGDGQVRALGAAAPRFGFAWVQASQTAFNPAFVREDEAVIGFELTHGEGAFALLSILIRNPRRRLLADGAPVWAWVSENGAPIFFGRLVAIPEDLHREAVTLNFIARPADFDARKRALAETLRVAPFWDPVWVAADRRDDPDVVLEARPAAWHIDRVTHEVTVSDITAGEDGLIEFDADQVLYDPSRVSYAAPPLRRVRVDAEISWDQTGLGAVDISGEVIAAFGGAGSPAGRISSFTGRGLEEDWPEPEKSIGGGWKVGESVLARVDGVAAPQRHADVAITGAQTERSGPGSLSASFMQPSITARFYVWEFLPTLTLAYDIKRRRAERVTFEVEADVQPIVTAPGEDEAELISVSSQAIVEPIDPGGAMPIGDLRRPAYLRTDRGRRSFEYLAMLARTKLLSRARAVQIDFATSFENALALSCRKSVAINDARLPGGRAVGKVIEYRLAMNGDGTRIANVRIGCTIGQGNQVQAITGAPEYVAADYVDDYQTYAGQTVVPASGGVAYGDLAATLVDDDGVDLFNLTPAAILKRLEVTDGEAAQRAVLSTSYPDIPAAVEGLNAKHTKVCLEPHSLAGGPFLTEYAPAVSGVMVPETISL